MGRNSWIEVEYNGVKYPNLKVFCEEMNLDLGVIRYRLKAGYSIEDAIKTDFNPRHRKVIYNGIEYPSIRRLAEELNLDAHKIVRRLSYGWTLKEAIEKPTIIGPRSKKVVYKGVTITKPSYYFMCI